MNINLNILEVIQPIGKFYIAKISGELLYEMSKADIMTISEENEDDLYEGIQRKLNESKVKNIEGYLTAYDATFPSSIILNVDKEKVVSQTDKHLELLKDKNTFSIIDGQHRLNGFRNYRDKEFEVIVSIFIGLSKEQQARIFTTINSEQSKVDPSISLFLEKNDSFYTPRKIVTQITSTFNTDYKSPWKGRIKLLGTKDDYSNEGIISLSAFAKPILNYIYPEEDFFKIRNLLKIHNGDINKALGSLNYDPNKFLFWEFYLSQNDKAIYKILYNFFNAFKTVFINDWGNQRSLLTKTTGYNAMMLLFKELYNIGFINNDLSEEFFYSHIKKLKYMEGEINSSNFGASGFKASKDLYIAFRKQLGMIELEQNETFF
jgi:DGQHR domain-containing protein